MRPIKDKTGMRFGRLTALRVVGKDKYSRSIWLCRCDCGNEKEINTAKLTREEWQTKSCGCLLAEGGIRTHAMSETRLYYVWGKMIGRCHSVNNREYHAYGARGISVCQEWKNSFIEFHFYMSSLPNFGEEGYSIDRIDNDGNYEPGNVRWATKQQQCRNTRQTILLTHKGETLCQKDWADKIGVAESTLRRRLRNGWTVEEALTLPKHTIKHPQERYIRSPSSMG